MKKIKLEDVIISILILVSVGIIIAFFVVHFINNPRDYDCVDFSTQEDAQRVFELHEKDIHGLDINSNNIACEGLK